MRFSTLRFRKCRRKYSRVLLVVWFVVIFTTTRLCWQALDPNSSASNEDDTRKVHGEARNTPLPRNLYRHENIVIPGHKRFVNVSQTQGNIINTLRNSNMRKVVNPHPFPVLLEPTDICRDPDLFVVGYVHSAPGYFSRRNHIRNTWGNPAYHNVKFRLFFVIGLATGAEHLRVQQEIYTESKKYHDILQEGFVDSYRNLSYKGLAALKWIDTHCEQVNYVFKADDDTFVNTFAFLKHLKSLETTRESTKNTIICRARKHIEVLREGKWKVEPGHYNASQYPEYCSGCAFTFTADVASAIYRESYYVPFLWVDDAYITGVIPEAIGTVSFLNLAAAYQIYPDRLTETFTGNRSMDFMFAYNIHRIREASRVWDKLVHINW